MSRKLSNNLMDYDTYDMLNCLKKISCSYFCNVAITYMKVIYNGNAG